MNIETTIVVEFGVESDYLSNVKLDPILNTTTDSEGNEVEKTSFQPTDKVYISAHFSDNVVVNSVVATDGAVVQQDMVSRTENASVLFASRDELNPDEYETPVIPSSVGVTYSGRVGSLSESLTSLGGKVFTADVANTPFLAEFVMGFSARIYKLDPPSGLVLEEDETYTVHVVFYITVL